MSFSSYHDSLGKTRRTRRDFLASLAAGAAASVAAPAIVQGGPAKADPIGRAQAAVDYLDGTIARRVRIMEANYRELDTIPDDSYRRRPGDNARIRELEAEIRDAFGEEIEAESALVLAIRRAAPGGGDPRKSHRFRAKDGRTFVALADGDEIDFNCLGRHDLTKIVVFESGERVQIDRSLLIDRRDEAHTRKIGIIGR